MQFLLKLLLSKYRFLLLLCFVAFVQPNAKAQERSLVTDTEIANLLDNADSCIKHKNQNCLDIYSQIFQLAKKRNLPYIDYLHLEYMLAIKNYLHQDSAMLYLNKILPRIKDKAIKDELLNEKAIIFYNKGQIDSAMQLFTLVVKHFEDRQDWENAGAVSINIASSLYSQNSYDRSIEYFKKALHTFHNINVADYDIYISSSIAKNYLSLKQFDSTEKWCKSALESPANNTFDKQGKSEASRTLARMYLFNNQPDSAYKYSSQGLQIANDLNNIVQMANANQIVADVLVSMGKNKEALNAIETAITLSKNKGYKVGLLENLYTAGRICRNLGLHKKSADYYHEAKTMKDEIKTDKSIKIINELTTKYETEKKERLLAESQLTIQKKNVLIRNWLIAGIVIIGGLITYFFFIKHRQKSRIKIMEKEKEKEILQAKITGEEIERGRISKELHDGVASSILVARMQLEKNEEETKEKTMNLLKDIHKEVRNISHKLTPINFAEKNWITEAQQYCDNINNEQTQVHFFSNQQQLSVDENVALMLFRTLQELLQNAIKHAEAKNISVQIIQEDKKLNITIEEDGKGANQEVIDKARSLTNLKKRLAETGIILTIESQPQSGTVAFINYKS